MRPSTLITIIVLFVLLAVVALIQLRSATEPQRLPGPSPTASP